MTGCISFNASLSRRNRVVRPVAGEISDHPGHRLLDCVGITSCERLEIRQHAGDAPALWEALTPGKQRGLPDPINCAKAASTPARAKRISSLTGAAT